ncbi:MAG: 2-thiouracil desulfurase family protein [Thermoproteota archaeon]
MRRILLVSHCILNPYSKAVGLLREEKVKASKRVIEALLQDLEIGVIQLPCPELLYEGLGRKPAARESYDNPEFREICKKIADQAAKIAAEYERKGVRIMAYLGVEGSPSCGVEWTHFMIDKPEKGRGVFTEILYEAMSNVGIRISLLGLPEKEKYGSLEELLRKLEASM